jgi:hypothetical protein
MMRKLFAPFSQKYIRLGGGQVNCHGSGEMARLLVGGTLDWHWGCRFDPLFNSIRSQREELSAAAFDLFGSSDDPCIVANQKTWKTDEAYDPWDRHRQRDDGPRDECREARPTDCDHWRMEHLAYYAPAHGIAPERYGIHLTKRGIVQVAAKLDSHCKVKQDQDVILLVAAYILFAHEACHAWIEDLVSLVEFGSGLKPNDQQSPYGVVQNRHNGYIFMEEAICNTAAYGLLHHFLTDRSDHTPGPLYDTTMILAACRNFMRKQPSGYKEFSPINTLPHESEIFIRNIGRLLIEIYLESCRYKDVDAIESVIRVFFGVDFHRFKHLRSLDRGDWDVLWTEEPPLHTEP